MGVYLRGKSWYIDFYYEGKRITERVGKVSKSVAEEKLRIKQSEVIRGEWKPKIVKVLFDKFKEQYLEFSEVNKKPSSYTRDECSLKHLSPFFGSKFLSDIGPFLVEKYKKDRKEAGAEPATINRELACLRNMLNKAVLWKKTPALSWSFGNKKDVKLLKEPNGPDRFLSEEEETRLMKAVNVTTKSQHLEPIIITALNTGMRKGEILNLKWPNVDFRAGLIVVEGTKNGEFKKIPMNKKLTETLERAKKVSRSMYVFSENERPYTDVKTGWWTALKKAKIEGFRFHDLRHTFGTRLAMKGYDIKTVAELMGHKDLKMTMRYFHSSAEQKRKAVEALDRVTTIFTTVPNTPDVDKAVSNGNY